MPVSTTTYKILFSCPSDVEKYYDSLRNVIDVFNETIGEENGINLQLKHWKTSSYPKTGDSGQNTLNKEFINDCDAAIAIFWTKFGNKTDKYDSGTQEEIMTMIESKKQVFLYFCDEDIPTTKMDDSAFVKEYQKVSSFKKDFEKKKYGLHGGTFKNGNELKNKLLVHLQKYFIDEMKEEKKKFDEEQKIKPFVTWDNQKEPSNLQNTFFSNDYIDEKKKEICSGNKCIRIFGQSGVGKTRIVYETFRESHDNYLYCNSIHFEKEKILQTCNELSKEDNEYNFVIDNCDDDLFVKLYKIQETTNTKSKFIVITHDYSEIEKENTIKILISIEKLDTIIEQIIDNEASDIDSINKASIKDFSAGNPMMAHLLIKGLRKNKQIGFLTDTEIIQAIIGNDAEEKEIMKTCSIFKSIGFKGEQEKQINLVVDSSNFTPGVSGNPQYREDKFVKLSNKMISSEVFECHGDFFIIRPTPISLHLGEEWYKNCKDSRLINCLKELDSNNDPSLIKSFCDKFVLLGRDPKTKNLIKSILKPTGPFGNAKVLTSNTGSQLFRSFIEVNPEATIETISYCLKEFGEENIININGYIRRNFVWTLEKGCFYQPTFEKSAKLLLKFALAENETYGNNSTNQFLHLFKIYLPGTEANLEERFSLIEYCLSSPDTREFGFKAIESAFDINSFYIGGAENQGLKKLDHYTPKENEIREYISQITQIIKNEINEKGEYSELCYSILANSFREFYRWRFADITFPLIKEIIENGKNDWDKMYDALCLIRDNDMNIFQYYQDDIFLLVNKLKKDDFVSRFIAISDYRHNKELKAIKTEESLKYFKEKYSELAKEFITQKIDIKILVNLFNIKYIHSIGFGTTLAELLQNNDKKTTEIIDSAIENIKENDVYPQIFIEFAQHVNENSFNYIVEKCKSDEKLASYLFSIYGGRSTLLDKIDVLYNIADNFPKLAFNFRDYWSHNPMGKWDIDENIAEHFKKLEKYGPYGINAILYFTFEYQHMRDISLPYTLNAIENILLHTSFFIPEIERDFLLYSIQYFLNRTANHELAKEFNIQFIDFIYSNRSKPFGIDMAYYKEVYDILLKKYFDDIWPELKDALKGENDKYIIFYKMKGLFGVFNSFGNDYRESDEQGIFFNNITCEKIQKELDDDILLQSRIMGIAPTFNLDGKRFSDAALFLMEKYGENKKMLEEFRTNMYSFSCAGSMAPYYEKCKKCVELFTSNTKNITAKEWARELSSNLDEFIAHERKRDEEAKLLYE